MITERGSLVRMNCEPMWYVHLEPDGCRLLNASILHTRTLGNNVLVTSLVNDTCTNWKENSSRSSYKNVERTLTLITLFSKTPNELFTVRTKSRLAMERGHELVAIDLVNPPSHRTSPFIQSGLLFELSRFFPLD